MESGGWIVAEDGTCGRVVEVAEDNGATTAVGLPCGGCPPLGGMLCDLDPWLEQAESVIKRMAMPRRSDFPFIANHLTMVH